MSAAITIENLVKTFRSTRALDGLDLDVATGEVHGFLGPNGAGDLLMESVFQECILDATSEGRTAVLSSHILAEAAKLCVRVTIIRHDCVVQTGSLGELRHLTRTSITVSTDRPVKGFDALHGVHDVRSDDGHLRFDVDGADLDGAIRHLSTFGIQRRAAVARRRGIVTTTVDAAVGAAGSTERDPRA